LARVTEVHGSGWVSARSHKLASVMVSTRNSERKILWNNELVKVSNQEAEERETFAEMGIPKNTHLKACQEENEDIIRRRYPKDYIFEI
jgi:hypothetical protein